jgi:hypothetical protein
MLPPLPPAGKAVGNVDYQSGAEPNKSTDMFWEDEKRRAREPVDNIHKKPS